MIWKPQPKQALALAVVCFELLFGGARWGGKTEAGLAWLLKPFLDEKTGKFHFEKCKRYSALILRRNGTDLRQWVRRAGDFYSSLGAIVTGKPAEIHFPGGAVFYTGHLSDEKSYLAYVGQEFQRILIEELNQLQEEIQYLKVMASCRSTVPGIKACGMSNTNPGGPGHVWIKNRWNIVGKPPYQTIWTTDPVSKRTRCFIPSTVDDNAIGKEFDPEYVSFLDALPKGLVEPWRWGDWSVFEGQYFTILDEHEIEPFDIPDYWPLWGGLDYGSKAHTSFGLYTRNEATNRVIRLCEYYQAGKSPPGYAADIKKLCKEFPWTRGRMPSETFGDPSMWTKVKKDERTDPVAPADAFYELGIVQANNDRVNGWRNCLYLLQEAPDGLPGFGYFRGYNPSFLKYVPAMVRDEKNYDDIKKCSIDHEPDQWRYGTNNKYARHGKSTYTPADVRTMTAGLLTEPN